MNLKPDAEHLKHEKKEVDSFDSISYDIYKKGISISSFTYLYMYSFYYFNNVIIDHLLVLKRLKK